MTRIYIFAERKREALNRVLAKVGVMPLGKNDKIRTSIYGTFYLTKHIPEDMEENGFTFEVPGGSHI